MAREEQGRDFYRGREERYQVFRCFKDVQHSHHRLREGFPLSRLVSRLLMHE